MRTTIKILGIGDSKTRALRDNLDAALSICPLPGKVQEVSEVGEIAASGVGSTPALMFDNQVISEGTVPSVEELADLLRNRMLYRSKLYRIRRITVAVDFSPASANAFRLAWQIAQQFDASIDLVHVMDSIFDGGRAAASGFMSAHLRTTEQELRDFAAEVLHQTPLDHDFLPDDVPPRLRHRVQFGIPEQVLEELSKRSDLLVMGTTGKGRLATRLFGTISTVLAQQAHCPVLLVPTDTPANVPIRDVVYASNFESNDPEKIRQVVAFTERLEAQMHFVHVGQADEPKENLERNLFKINYKYANTKRPFKYERLLGDNVADRLTRYADRHHAGLLVLMTLRRGRWADLLHQSVSKQVLLQTHRPVLIVHQFNDLKN